MGRVVALHVALASQAIEFVVVVVCRNRRGARLVGQGRGLRDEIAVSVVGVADHAGLGVGNAGDPCERIVNETLRSSVGAVAAILHYVRRVTKGVVSIGRLIIQMRRRAGVFENADHSAQPIYARRARVAYFIVYGRTGEG